MTSPRIGELLVKPGLITPQDLERALNEQRTQGGKLGSNLLRMGLVDEKQLIGFLSKQFAVPCINLSEVEADPSLHKLLTLDIMEKYQAVPIKKEGSTILLAVSDPSNHFVIEDVRFHTGLNVKLAVASEAAIKAAIDKYYDDTAQMATLISDFKEEEMEIVTEEAQESVTDLKKATEEPPVVRLVNLILTNAVKKGASD